MFNELYLFTDQGFPFTLILRNTAIGTIIQKAIRQYRTDKQTLTKEKLP